MDGCPTVEKYFPVIKNKDSVDSLVSSRPVRTMVSCSTMEKWRSFSHSQKLEWVRLTLECEHGKEFEYVDMVNRLDTNGEIK